MLVCVCVCARARVCACVCVCARARVCVCCRARTITATRGNTCERAPFARPTSHHSPPRHVAAARCPVRSLQSLARCAVVLAVRPSSAIAASVAAAARFYLLAGVCSCHMARGLRPAAHHTAARATPATTVVPAATSTMSCSNIDVVAIDVVPTAIATTITAHASTVTAAASTTCVVIV